MPIPEHPMLPHLVDLESPFEPSANRGYDPVELVRYALGTTDYWAEVALGWLEQGVQVEGVRDELSVLESESRRPQALRHRAKALRKQS